MLSDLHARSAEQEFKCVGASSTPTLSVFDYCQVKSFEAFAEMENPSSTPFLVFAPSSAVSSKQ